jgi:hypothetical protein
LPSGRNAAEWTSRVGKFCPSLSQQFCGWTFYLKKKVILKYFPSIDKMKGTNKNKSYRTIFFTYSSKRSYSIHMEWTIFNWTTGISHIGTTKF